MNHLSLAHSVDAPHVVCNLSLGIGSLSLDSSTWPSKAALEMSPAV